MQFGITLVAFALIGIWLDRKLGTSPMLIVVGVFGGAAIGFWQMYRAMIRKTKQ